MTGDDVLDDGQAQPGSTHGAATTFVHPIKPLCQAVEVFFFDAFTVIADSNPNALVVGSRFDIDADRTALAAILQGVFNQIPENLR